MSFEEKLEKADLDANSVFIASFMAGLNEFRLLNQGVVDFATRRTGKYLARLVKYKKPIEIDLSKPVEDRCKKVIVETLNGILKISDEVEVEKAEDDVVVRIKSSGCGFCPKGVGEAELEGTICPFPGLIEEFVRHFCKKDFRRKRVNGKILNKEGDWCKIIYEIK